MGNIRLGSLFGFEIRVDYSWFAVLFLMAFTLSRDVFPNVYGFSAQESWVLGSAAALLLFGSVLVHELSHCIVARRTGMEVSGILLFLFGGVAQIKGEPESPREELLIAGIGPVTSVALGLACLGVSWSIPAVETLHPWAALLNYAGIVNLGLAVFNMAPAFPLDGGRILRSGLWFATRNLRSATGWAALLGQFFGWSLAGYGLFQALLRGDLSGLWLVMVGAFLIHAARSSYQQVVLREELGGVSVGALMSSDLVAEEADRRVRDFVDSRRAVPAGGSFPVVRAGQLVGIVRTDDIRRLPRDLWGVTCLGTLARSADEGIVDERQDAWSAVSQMADKGLAYLLVVRDGRLRGVFEEAAITRARQRPALRAQRRLPA